MFIDYTAPLFSKNDVVKIKGKSIPFKITDIVEEEATGEILYYVTGTIKFLISSDQITHTITKQTKK